MGLNKEEKERAKVYAANNAEFMFEPYSSLCELIAQDDPRTKGMDILLKTAILDKKAIRLDPKMIIKYCNYKLDRKNTFILDNGDIRVTPPQFSIKKENDNENWK